MQPLAALLDSAWGGEDYAHALDAQRAKVEDSSLTPAAHVLAEMHEHGQTFFQWAAAKAEQHRQYFLERPLDEAMQQEFAELANRSLQAQKHIEESDTGTFEEFLGQYYAQYVCCQS
jgi:glutamate--cysteine ligase